MEGHAEPRPSAVVACLARRGVLRRDPPRDAQWTASARGLLLDVAPDPHRYRGLPDTGPRGAAAPRGGGLGRDLAPARLPSDDPDQGGLRGVLRASRAPGGVRSREAV